jgi:O-antigen/teichoic acid export membrane protein
VTDPLQRSIRSSLGACPSCGVPAASISAPPAANLLVVNPGRPPRPRRPPARAGAEPDPADQEATRPDTVGASVRRATPLAVAGALSGLANLGVTLIVARELSNRAYGAFAQLFAIFFVLSMPGSALLVGVVRTVTVMRRDGQDIAAWTGRVQRASLLFVVAAALTAFGGGHHLARALGLPDAAGVGAIVTAGAAWVPLSVGRGLLQCDRRYPALAANLAIEAVARCGGTVLLVVAGGGPAAAAWATLGGVLAGTAHARWLARRSGAGAAPAGPGPIPGARRNRLAGDVACALVALGLLGVLQNMDVIVVGKIAPDRVGSYAAVSVACKVLVFAAAVLGGFLLPEAAGQRARGRHALHQLGGTLLIIAVPAAVLLAIAVCAPGRLLRIAFGPGLTGSADALAPLAAAMTALAATVLFTHYLLAVGRRRIVLALAVAAAVGVALLARTDGGSATARADLVVQLGLTVVTGLLVLTATPSREPPRRKHRRAARGHRRAPREHAVEGCP